MIYSTMIKKASILAYNAHKGQVDKSGYPYIMHPLHLAEQMQDEDATIVALLHDTVEDTSVTIEQLETMGFNKNIIEAISLLTHNDDVIYEDYIHELSKNPLASKVKLADLKHNSDLSRFDIVTDKDKIRNEKYKKSILFLEKSI